MKKKKFLLVFAGLTVSCMLTAGTLVGCGEKHEHAYSKWANDDTQHWLVCPDDNAKDENSVADHEFGTDGKCVECGYEKPHSHAYTKWRTSDTEHWKVCPDDNTEGPGTRAPHNYVNGECECGLQVGSVEGTVKLYKLGNYETDLTGVTVKINDDEITLDSNGSFGKTNLAVDKTYQLTVTKPGYGSYTENIQVEKGAVKQLGTDGVITLQYSIFNSANFANIDYSKANDGILSFKSKGKVDGLTTIEKYDKVDVSAKFEITESSKTSENQTVYCVGLKFDDGKEVRLDVNYSKNLFCVIHPDYRTLWTNEEYEHWHIFVRWDTDDGSVSGNTVADPHEFYDLVQDGLDYRLIRNGAYVTLIIEDKVLDFVLPESYASQKASVMFVVEETGDNTGNKINYTITDKLDVSEVELTTNAADFAGAAAVLDKENYEINDTVKLTVTIPANKVATVIINDGDPRILETSGEIKFRASESNTVSVVFANDKFSGDVTVDAKFNGKTLTFKKDGQTDVVLTVTDGKVTFTDIKPGEWEVTCNLLGTTLKTAVNLTEDITEINLSSFVKGGYNVNLVDGSFTWNTGDLKNTDFDVLTQAGDAYVALKLEADNVIEFLNSVKELHFGLRMMVDDQTKQIVLGQHTWEDSFGVTSKNDGANNGINILRDFLWNHSEHKTNGFYDDYSFGIYGAKIEDGGIYYVMQYESATGKGIIYLSDGESYFKVYEETLFEEGGTLKGFGFAYDNGQVWGYKGDLSINSTIHYGATFNAAIGAEVSEWKPVINITDNKADFDGANVVANKNSYSYGDTVTITVTVPENKIATVTVDGGTSTILENTDEITFTAKKSAHTVNVVFANDKFSGDVTVDAKFNGKTLTFKKDGQEDVQLTVTDGKVTFTNIKLGEWNVTCDLLGTTLKTTVTLSDGMTALDLSGFATGTAEMDLATGSFKWHHIAKETTQINFAEAKTGDAYVGLKIKYADDFLAYAGGVNEWHFGISMKVGAETHYVTLNWHTWEKGNFGFGSDKTNVGDNDKIKWHNHDADLYKLLFNQPASWQGYSYGEMGESITKDGLYLIMRYVSATGNAEMYVSDGKQAKLVWTANGLFKAESALEGFGVVNYGDDYNYRWGSNGDNRRESEFTFTLNYGTSLTDLLGVEVKDITVTKPDVEYGTVIVTGSKVGDVVSINVAPADNGILKSLKVNGKDVKGELDNDGNLSLGYYIADTLTIEAEFVEHVDIVVSGIDPQPENGTVAVQGAKVGDGVEITFTPGEDSYLSALTVNGENRLADVVNGKLNLGIYWNTTLEITAAFTKEVSQDFSLSVDEKFNGVTLTLKRARQDDITATVDNGKLDFNGKPGEYTVEGEFLGTTLKFNAEITADATSIDLSKFASGTAGIDVTTGGFVYQQKNDNSPTVNVDLAQGVSGDAYVALKLSTNVAKDDWVLQHEELHLGVWMTVGGSKHWVELHWRNWDSGDFGIHSDSAHDHKGSDVLKQNLWQPSEGFSFDNHGWNMNAYGEAFMSDGIYLVMKYDSATGNVDVLLAKADGYVKVCTFDAMFEAGKELTAFGVGKIGNDYNYHNCSGGFQIDCVLNYGTTLGGATGEQITEEPKA